MENKTCPRCKKELTEANLEKVHLVTKEYPTTTLEVCQDCKKFLLEYLEKEFMGKGTEPSKKS
jgi:uncharacterized protein with PIN domain